MREAAEMPSAATTMTETPVDSTPTTLPEASAAVTDGSYSDTSGPSS